MSETTYTIGPTPNTFAANGQILTVRVFTEFIRYELLTSAGEPYNQTG